MWLACAVGVALLSGGTDARTLGSDLVFPEKVEARGEIREHLQRLQRAYDRLCAPPMDDLQFVLSDVNFHFTRRFTQYSGDVSGRMLGALNAADPVLGTHSPMIEQLQAAFPQYQKTDGHFGAEQDLKQGVKGERDMPILWGNGRLLLALAERYRTKPDPQLLNMAKGIGDYVISTRPYFGLKENFTKVGGAYSSGYTTCYPSLIDGLAALGQISGERRFYEEARFIARLSLLDSEFENHHSHGRLSAYRGMLDLDRFTGKPEFLDIVRKNCETIVKDYMLPTGGITERFDRDDPRDEGCSEADWIRVNLLLWQMTGEMKYIDQAECALRNHLMASQFPNGGFGHHTWRKLKHGDTEYPGGAIGNVGSEAYWCCSMHGTQILAEIPQWSVLARDNKVLVTWLGECGATLKLKDQTVTVTADKVAYDTWRVTADAEKATTLRLRVPYWVAPFKVDDKEIRGKDGWAEVEVKAGRTAMEILLTHLVRRADAYKEEPRGLGVPTRFFAGPDILCLPEHHVPADYLSSDTIPRVANEPKRQADNTWTAFVYRDDNADCVTARLVPLIHRPPGACRFFFRPEPVVELPPCNPYKPTGVPIEVIIACDGLYEMYLNGQLLIRRNNVAWVESPFVDAYGQPGKNVIAIKTRSNDDHPAVIATIQSGDRKYVTHAEGWSAISCPKELAAEWLTDVQHASDKSVKLIDKGGFGAPPWLHMSAAFAGTDARWIWPDESDTGKKRWWLVRYAFDLPGK